MPVAAAAAAAAAVVVVVVVVVVGFVVVEFNYQFIYLFTWHNIVMGTQTTNSERTHKKQTKPSKNKKRSCNPKRKRKTQLCKIAHLKLR